MSLKPSTPHDSFRAGVLAAYPEAVAWWNCMEFSWMIWHKPAADKSARCVGESDTEQGAWMAAAVRMGL